MQKTQRKWKKFKKNNLPTQNNLRFATSKKYAVCPRGKRLFLCQFGYKYVKTRA